jgi:hypothetical protein
VLTAAVLLALAPFAWLANTLATRREASLFKETWTSLMMVFTVGQRRSDAGKEASPLREPSPASAGR